jgi:chromosome segregation ATPase
MLTYDNITAIESIITGDEDGTNIPLPLLKQVLHELASRVLVADTNPNSLENFALAADEALARQDREIAALEEEAEDFFRIATAKKAEVDELKAEVAQVRVLNDNQYISITNYQTQQSDLRADIRLLEEKLNRVLVQRDDYKESYDLAVEDLGDTLLAVAKFEQNAERYAMLKAILPNLLEIAATAGANTDEAAAILKQLEIDKLDAALDVYLVDPEVRADLGL